jgi:hypothetical protein
MSTSNYDSSKLASIKTYMLLAFIFNIIGMIAFGLLGIWQIISWATWSGYSYYGVLAGWSTGFLIWGVVLLVFFVFSLVIFMTRVRKMYNAVNRGNIATLKSLNNMTWAILALIFAAVIPGIMLMVAFGPINELGSAPPPPPPPT